MGWGVLIMIQKKWNKQLVLKNYVSITCVLCMLLCFSYTHAQNLSIQLSDSISKEKIADATIKIIPLLMNKAQSVISKSNADGMFSMYVSYPVVLKISIIGYQPIVDTLKTETNKVYFMHPLPGDLNAVTITADYSQSRAKQSVHDIRILDKKIIDQKGATNLRELLTNELSMQISQDNILGSSVSQQGLSGENIKVLVDGVPVIGRLNGNIDLSQINLNNVERVEIIEGPLSVLYGSNALGGVINIITKTQQNDLVQAAVNTYYEHVGQYNIDGSVGLKLKNNSIQFNGGRYFFDGFAWPDTSRFKQWKPREQYFGDASYLYKNKNVIFRLKAELYNEKITDRGQPRQPFGINAFDNTFKTKRYNGNADFMYTFNNEKSIQVKAAYNYYKRESNQYFKDLTNLESVITSPDNQDTSVFTNIMARAIYANYNKTKKLTYQTGVDINYETGIGKRILDKEQHIGDYAAFSSLEYKPIAQLTFKPAVRIAYNSKYKAPIVPSLNIRYKALSNLTFRFSYARGFRAPSLKELYFFFVDINHNIRGNEDLKAETSHNFILSADYVSQIKNTHVLSLKTSAYYNDVSNLIRLASVDGTLFTYINVAKNKTAGANIELNYTYKTLQMKVGVQVNSTYSDFGGGVTSGKFISVPVCTYSTSYLWKKTGLTLSMFYKYTGRQPGIFLATTNQVNIVYLNSFHMLDISVSRSIYKDFIRLTLGGKNLCNVRNITATGDFNQGGIHNTATNTQPIGWGASFFASLHFQLNNSSFKKNKL